VTYPAPAAADACSAASVTCTPASNAHFPRGTTTVSCTATDVAGNTSSCAFTVTRPTVKPREATRLQVDKAAGQFLLSWEADCAGSSTYAVYRGDLQAGYASIAPEPGLCDVTGTSAMIPLGTGNAEFFLVVPHTDGEERSYGTDSFGTQRPPAANACYPQGAFTVCSP
jgi:hypothetical protein